MAVEINIKVTSVKDKFKLSDITGIYNVTTNPTGYGAPNIAIGAFTGCTIEVTFPDGTTMVSIDAYPTMPTNAIDFIYEITAEDLGVESLEPGIYIFNYIPTDGTDVDYTVCKKVLYYWPIECCISKKVKSMSVITSSKEQVCEVAYAERQLKAAISAACSGNALPIMSIRNADATGVCDITGHAFIIAASNC